MSLRTLLVLAAVLAAFVAGRATSTRVEARPISYAASARAVGVPTVHCPAPAVAEVIAAAKGEDDDPDAVDAEHTDAIRQLARIADLTASLGPHGALRGQIRHAQTGEPLAGATVTAERGEIVQTAISDEHGWFEIANLPQDAYTVTVYYIDATTEHRNVAVSARQITPFHAVLDTTPSAERPIPEPDTYGVRFEDVEERYIAETHE